jgi:SAM-dependent methyltransferase
MKLANWPYDKVDLDKAVGFAENPSMSVMANAVDLLNVTLLSEVRGPIRLLEIGCGAYSLIRDRLPPPALWEGIDVIDVDRKGNPSIATRRASVEDIPWPDGTFDIVVSNQSIEHWYEYGVAVERGLAEIRRVLKPEGRAYINFPIHLHGERMFVEGEFTAIDAAFESVGLVIQRRVAVEKPSNPPYRGWRLCGFPDFMVTRCPSREDTSYVVEYVLSERVGAPLHPLALNWTGRPRLTTLQRHWRYGLRYLFWKVTSRLLRRERVAEA